MRCGVPAAAAPVERAAVAAVAVAAAHTRERCSSSLTRRAMTLILAPVAPGALLVELVHERTLVPA